jgi:plastocyanin
MTNRLLSVLLIFLMTVTAAALAQDLDEVTIVQKNRDFQTNELTVSTGSVLAFSNLDEFPHQISAKGPGVLATSGLQRTGEVLRIPAPEPGDIQVRCGIHPRMRLTVHVR